MSAACLVAAPPPGVSALFASALRLGLTSFGGPVAHLGYFRTEYVERRRWLDDRAYADLVALCQILPGPTSSQVGMGIGWRLAGWTGMLAAWVGFTLPSALIMAVFGLTVAAAGPAVLARPEIAPVILALKLVAVAVVAQALDGMARSLCPDRPRRLIAVAATILALLVPGVGGQLAVLLLGALAALALPVLAGASGTAEGAAPPEPVASGAGRRLMGLGAGRWPIDLGAGRWPVALLAGLAALLLTGLPFADTLGTAGALVAEMLRAGLLVFGGGHVVLPLLEPGFTGAGPLAIGRDAFLAGYGLAQAVPGPLFTLAAYLGAVVLGPVGALAAVVAIFLPSLIAIPLLLPLWGRLAARPGLRRLLDGVNAAVVGLLAAAFYDPVLTAAVTGPASAALALAAYAALVLVRLPPWLVVLVAAGLGAVVGQLA